MEQQNSGKRTQPSGSIRDCNNGRLEIELSQAIHVTGAIRTKGLDAYTSVWGHCVAVGLID